MQWNQTLTAIVLAGCLAAGLHPALGQDAPAASFMETIEVRMLNLEVVVSDRDGQRVTGLGRDDFRLLVDGEEVPIQFFNEVRDGRVVGSEACIPTSPPIRPRPPACWSSSTNTSPSTATRSGS